MLAELTPFEIQLRNQILKNWKNYNPKRIDLGIARDKQQYDLAGKYICVEKLSSADAEATIILNDKDNGELDLVDGVEIETLFKKVFITNTAQAGKWIDIIFGADFRYRKTGRTPLRTAQPALIITNVAADTNTPGDAHPCTRALVRSLTTNTGTAWVDFKTPAVSGSCFEATKAGDAISVPLGNTDQINVLFDTGGDKVTVVYEA